MMRRKQCRRDRHQRHAVGPILVILPALVEDDVALRLEAFRGDSRQQISHAIRFHPQGQVDRARRHDLPVVGAIGVRRSVEQRTSLLQRREIAGVVVLRPLEHQMLEQVGETGAAGALVLGTDVVPDVDGDDRHLSRFVDDDVEAVVEGVLAEGEFDGAHVAILRRLDYRAIAADPNLVPVAASAETLTRASSSTGARPTATISSAAIAASSYVPRTASP
jgi:hypothetical protein